MTYYHVTITTKFHPTNLETKFDLDFDQLEIRFLGPYRKGRSVTIEGKSISADDIERIRIYETEQESAYYLPIVERER